MRKKSIFIIKEHLELREMGLKDFLVLEEGEEILVKYGISEYNGIWVATNKRVIKYLKKLIGEEFCYIPYDKITSLEFVSKSTGGIEIGLIFLFLGFSLFILKEIIKEIEITEIFNLLGIYLLFAAIIFIFIGIIFKNAYYQLYALGLNNEGNKKWRLNLPWYRTAIPEDLKKFELIMREKLT